MSLRTYKAATMAAALDLVKKDLGPDAVILETRTLSAGGLRGLAGKPLVEIVATANGDHLEGKVLSRSNGRGDSPEIRRRPSPPRGPDIDAQSPIDHSTARRLQSEIQELKFMVSAVLERARHATGPAVSEPLTPLYTRLLQNQVAAGLAEELVAQLHERGHSPRGPDDPAVRDALAELIGRMAPTCGPLRIRTTAKPTVVALVGPTGSGKTTTVAKLAADFSLRQGKRVALITTDTHRVAATDQLRTYANIIAVSCHVASTPDDIAMSLAGLVNHDLVLLDTAGCNQNNAAELSELQRFLRAARPHETHLVLSSTCGAPVMTKAIECFSRIGADRLIMTKLDEAVGFGVMLEVVRQAPAKLSYLTTGKKVPDGIEAPNARSLTRYILHGGWAAEAETSPGRERLALDVVLT